MKGVCIHGGHTLDIARKDGKLVSATVHAGKDDALTTVRQGKARSFDLKRGQSLPFEPK